MNQVILTGKISGEIINELDKEMRCCKFKLRNTHYKPTVSNTEVTTIPCITYGGLAEYCYNELYEGCNVIITGRVLSRHYVSKGFHIDRMYVGCTTVSKLDQEEYC